MVYNTYKGISLCILTDPKGTSSSAFSLELQIAPDTTYRNLNNNKLNYYIISEVIYNRLMSVSI